MASRGKRFSSTEAVRNLDSSLIDVHWSVWGVKPCWIANATQTVGEEKVHTGYAACCEYGWKPQNTCSADAWTASTMRILATEPGRGGGRKRWPVSWILLLISTRVQKLWVLPTWRNAIERSFPTERLWEEVSSKGPGSLGLLLMPEDPLA